MPTYNDFYGILAIIFLIGGFISCFSAKEGEKNDWAYAGSFIITLLTGTALYSFAIGYENGADTSFPFFIITILKSMSVSAASFGGNSYEFVGEALAKESRIFHAAIVIHFLVSVSLISLIIIKWLGKNMLNTIRVYWISRGKKYIVAGCGEQAGIFLKNLSKQKRRTIVIIPPDQADKKKGLIDNGYAVVLIKETTENGEDGNFTAFEDALKTAGVMRWKHETKVISMFDNDETNLLVARIIEDYIAETKKHENGEKAAKIKLDVRIMYGFLERAEHFAFIEKALGKVRFFNIYEIRAREFMLEHPITKLIPRHWIDTDKARLKIRRTYKIGNIFVGFGSTNKAILKTSIINNQLLNVDYNALVITKDKKTHEMRFKNSAIGLFDEVDENGKIIKRGAEIKDSVYLESPSERNNIVFKEADALSVELYDFIIEEIGGSRSASGELLAPPCDYATVIIALGDNRLSIETALELRQKLYETDLLTGRDVVEDGGIKTYQRVKIFVKVDNSTIFADEKILNNESIDCKIKVFGENEKVLTEEYIIHEKLDILAKNIANRYEGSAKTSAAADKNKWNTLTQFKRESNRYAAMGIRVKLNLLGLDLKKVDKPDNKYCEEFRTKYGTNAAFDLRAERKRLDREIKLARDGKDISEEIRRLNRDEVIDLAVRDNGDFADTPRNNLAKLEHQRWNAFHLANDWTKLPKEEIDAGDKRQDKDAKQHACITTFKGLEKLREIQKDEEIKKNREPQHIDEINALLNADTINYDFDTMDFLLDVSDENLLKLRDAEGEPDKMYTGILKGSGCHICGLDGIIQAQLSL